MKSFNEWVSSIAEAGMELLAGTNRQPQGESLIDLCRELCSSKGEAMGTALAHRVVKAYHALTPEEQLAFFQSLCDDFCPDPEAIIRSAEAYKQNPNLDNYRELSHIIEAPRQQLFRRINMAPKGTATLIQMRQDLLALTGAHPAFAAIDADLKHLLISWFNRGFLTLKEINWRTPAHILEKLIAYEAVHEMSGWDDLRRRLADDRRCFAFFHPALEDEPLIFVEVALVKGIAGNVQELLAEPQPNDNNGGSHKDFDTAIFYSISNCQEGLKGISFGNFLIKQVVLELRKEFEQLKQFATLSPIPGFYRWLKREVLSGNSPLVTEEELEKLTMLDSHSWHTDPACSDALKPILLRLCAHYLYHAKKGTAPADPVSRFHLGNGAQIARLNWLGDTSSNGLKQSAGLLVNYAYELKKVEANHEAFFNAGTVAVAGDFQKLLK